MYIKGQTGPRQPNVNICKVFCRIHYSLFTQSVGPPLGEKVKFHIFCSWNVDEKIALKKIETVIDITKEMSTILSRRQPFVLKYSKERRLESTPPRRENKAG